MASLPFCRVLLLSLCIATFEMRRCVFKVAPDILKSSVLIERLSSPETIKSLPRFALIRPINGMILLVPPRNGLVECGGERVTEGSACRS